VLAELAAVAGALLLVAGSALLVVVVRLRRQVRAVSWLLRRAALRAAEARRASLVEPWTQGWTQGWAGGSALLDQFFGRVARDGEADPDAAG